MASMPYRLLFLFFALRLSAALYPEGTEFPLGLYSLDTKNLKELNQVIQSGWNLGQTYREEQKSLADALVPLNAQFLLMLGEKNPSGGKNLPSTSNKDLLTWRSQKNLAWWGLPEELRYFRKEEKNLFHFWVKAIEKIDAGAHPKFMYLPGHYTAEQIQNYVADLDIIGAGGYNEYSGMPRAWTRYRIEATQKAITLVKRKIGANYRGGEKTPICILSLFRPANQKLIPTPEGARHDFFSCLAGGAKGILVFSYFHRQDPPGLNSVFDAYSSLAKEVRNDPEFQAALLFGERTEVATTITEGPIETETFTPVGMPPMRYPSLQAVVLRNQKRNYLLTVNSSAQPIRATITASLPKKLKSWFPKGSGVEVPLLEWAPHEAKVWTW